MSAHKHEYLDPERARGILANVPPVADMHGLRLMAQRALMPVTTEEERRAVREFNAARGYNVCVPDVQAPAPSAPASDSSERGAKAIEPHRKGQYRTVMLTLARHEAPISRDALHRETGIAIASLCGRLAELAPTWIEVVKDVCTSDAGVLVDGYRLTEQGRKRMQEAAA